MINTLLFIHLIIAILLIVVILLQKTSTDGLSGIGGGGNMGLVSSRSAANFLTKITIVLAIIFFANALLLANLSSKSHDDIATKLEKSNNQIENNTATEPESLPMAK